MKNTAVAVCRDDVAEDVLFSCAEEAANKATKEMASLLIKDAEEREKRWIESDRMMMENLNGTGEGFPNLLKEESLTWIQGCRLVGRSLKRSGRSRSSTPTPRDDRRASHSNECARRNGEILEGSHGKGG